MKKIICSIFLCTLLCACGKASIEVKEGIVVEYGAELKVENLTDEKVTLKEVKGFDAKKTGEQKVTAVFVNEKDKEIEEEITLQVQDTKKPVIKLKKEKIEITAGDKFDAASNIESVKDPVDGDLKKSEDKKLTKNGYIITSDVNSKKAGNYTVKVTAYDVNGNKAESSYNVTVKKKSQEQTPTQNNNQSSGNNSTSNNQGSYKPSDGNSGSSSKPNQSKPTTTAKVCPNGKKPINPSLPCDAWHTSGIDQCYKDASGKVVAFRTAEAAYDWADAQLMNPDRNKNFQIKYGYSSFVTTPIAKNDGTEYHGVTFMK